MNGCTRPTGNRVQIMRALRVRFAFRACNVARWSIVHRANERIYPCLKGGIPVKHVELLSTGVLLLLLGIAAPTLAQERHADSASAVQEWSMDTPASSTAVIGSDLFSRGRKVGTTRMRFTSTSLMADITCSTRIIPALALPYVLCFKIGTGIGSTANLLSSHGCAKLVASLWFRGLVLHVGPPGTHSVRRRET